MLDKNVSLLEKLCEPRVCSDAAIPSLLLWLVLGTAPSTSHL